MGPLDLAVRRHVYGVIVATGRAPTVGEAARALGRGTAEVEAAYRRLDAAHALVLAPGTTEIWIANPFCFAPTPHRVTAVGREWVGTCCWDALGIPGAFHADGIVDTSCACCGELLRLEVVDGTLAQGGDLLAHILVPARHWWDDIAFT